MLYNITIRMIRGVNSMEVSDIHERLKQLLKERHMTYNGIAT